MSRSIKHLLLTTVEDPYNRNTWSGITYSLREALERNVDKLSVFRPSRPSRNVKDVVLRQLYGGGKKPRYPLWMTNATLRKNAREIGAEIDRIQPDAVLSISSQCLAYLDRPGTPQYLFSDSDWMTWLETYSGFDKIPVRAPQFAALEAQAAQRIDGVFFGSEWAVREARAKYSLQDERGKKIHAVPLGANWVPEVSRDELLQRIDGRNKDCIQLLYVGVDWERKGGPLTVDVAVRLRDLGRKVMLHIVGCRPEIPSSLTEGDGAIVTIHGRLNKNEPEQRSKMQELYLQSHFLIVPTRAECYGIVFAEAQAFGLPPISRDITSLPTIVLDGETGLLQPVDAQAEVYVDRILTLVNDPAAYRSMVLKALTRYDSILNWDSTARTMLAFMEEDQHRAGR